MTPELAAGWADVPALRDEALRLCARGAERNITLRVTGSLGVLLHSPRAAELLERLGRRAPRDIDFMAYAREQRAIEQLFTEEGWTLDPIIRWSREWGVKRLIYRSPGDRFKVDVFLDQLVMAHTVDLRGRLGLDEPAVPLVDLLLSKLQIHEITHNDLADLVALLVLHDLGDGRAGTIDRARLLAVLNDDWGFWYTARTNLGRVGASLDGDTAMTADEGMQVRSRVDSILADLDTGAKSRRWRLRAAVGTRLAWYQDVDEVDRGEGSEPA